jgi:hypothetical protein
MKSLYKILAGLFILALATITSCKKFIKEELVTQLTGAYYNTDQGLEDLVKSAYVPLKWKFEGEQSYALWNFGLDEFRVGDQFNNEQFNRYNSNLNSNGPDGFVNALWTNYYAGIYRCNLGIEKIAAFDDPNSTKLGTAAQKNLRIAELKFLRAFYYFTLVQQFGGVPVVTVPPAEVQTDFPRNSVAEVYKLIIDDLRTAGPSLPWKAPSAEVGRASRAATYHFLAKAYLTRGSAVTEARGQQPTDMDSVIVFADSVIKFSGHVLESNFGNLFSSAYATHIVPRAGTDGSAPVGSLATINANNNSNEIIFAAQFSQNLALAGLNNQTHMFYPVQYDAGIPIPGMTRDFFNGRPFRRLRPTDYTMDLFDKVNDSRFFKTFQTAFYRNVTSNSGLPVFTASNAPTPDVIGRPRVGIGDTAGLFIVNTPDKPLTRADSAKFRYYGVYIRYKRNDVSSPVYTEFTPNKYLTMVKFADGVRITNTANEARGIRNGLLARLAETYLILAEAYGRKDDYGNALLNVNIVRTRAAYKAGEPKNPHHWMFYGGEFNDINPTSAAVQATTDLFTTNAASELYPPSVGGTKDRFIHFMLNEKTRELCGELFRWEDLARTETFYERSKLYNADATNIAPFHKLRPIPLPQIIGLTRNGKPLTPTEITAYQNPGY